MGLVLGHARKIAGVRVVPLVARDATVSVLEVVGGVVLMGVAQVVQAFVSLIAKASVVRIALVVALEIVMLNVMDVQGAVPHVPMIVRMDAMEAV